ncbi:MAG: transcription termination/antitermination protein NusA [Candidatus Moranbacteria bacterium]|nr:transcription termination/antitermination protein NusA [Candidatus Moranbacteria bacterium]
MQKNVQNINIKELSSAIAQICEEKGLAREIVIKIVGDALAAAYKKDYGKKGQVIKADFDPKKQTADFYLVKEVVDENTRNFEPFDPNKEAPAFDSKQDQEKQETPRFNEERDITLKEAKKIEKDAKVGDEIRIKLPSQNTFGRVAAQNAKQVIIQKLREAEREILFNEFKDKEEEVITATVQRIENKNVYLDLGKTVGILFPSEQIPGEVYRPGQRVKVYVDRVSQEFKDTTVILSRANPKLVVKLFQLEVPEIFAGTVAIESIAREPGSRTKIAVKSMEEGIDPIGSCVGQKGIRVQSIIDELGGEKIDIIQYNEDPKVYITQALAPAKIQYVDIDENEKRAVAYTDADQLSLAIGKRGQNVRLAAKLTGWKIDVLTQEEAQELLEKQKQEEKEQAKDQEKETRQEKEAKVKQAKKKSDSKKTKTKEKKKNKPKAKKKQVKQVKENKKTKTASKEKTKA